MKIYQSTISNRSSNEEIKFNCDALSLYKLTFSLNAIGLNTTMTLYDFYGSINSQVLIDKPSKIEIQFFSLSKLTFSDTLQYDFFITEQKLQCANEQEYADLFLHQKFAIVPLNETGLAKDASLSNVKKLQFDSSNNLKSNVVNEITTDIGTSNIYAKDSSVQSVVDNTTNIGKMSFDSSGNQYININASMRLPTDTGLYTQTLEENQTSGTNVLTYNPYNFSNSTNYGAGSPWSQNPFVQQNGSRGYINFSFWIYNPTSSAGSQTITCYLYNHLPETGWLSNDYIRSFSFTTPSIPANSGQWVYVYPNIFWEYNTLVFMQSPNYTGSNIGNPSLLSQSGVNSHYWTGSYWNNSSSNPQIMYWSITNSAPASLPVSVQSGDITIHSYSAPAKLYQYNANSSYEYTFSPVPVGKRWKILSMSLQGQGANGNSTSLIVYIYPTSTNQNIASYIFAQSSVLDSNTASPAYVQLSLIADGTGSYLIPSSSSNYETMIFTSLYLYPNQTIKMQTSNTTAYTLGYIEIEYIEENAF